jgi:ABC-2 type transport system permease protein
MRELMLAELVQRRRMLLALGAGVFVFLVVLGGTYQAFGGPTGIAESLGGDDLPSFYSAFAGEPGVDIFEPANYLALGLIHPLFLVLTLTVGLSIGSAAVAGDVETGRAEMLYAHPRRRTAIVDARLAMWAGAQAVVLAAAFLGAYAGTRISADLQAVPVAGIVRIVVQYGALVTFFSAAAFCASALAHTRGQALGTAIGVAAVCYLANLVALLWHPLSFLRRVSPFGYYSPTRAVTAIDWVHAAVLLGAAAALVVVARLVVERRDLV